jgi:hypothetical protein
VELCQRDTPLSYYLKKAVCFHSCFISTHPDLFPNNPNPTFNDRLQAAQNYAIDPMHFEFMNQVNPMDNQQLCDDIRAVLVHCLTQFCIGNSVYALELLHKAAQFLKQFGILNKRSLEDHSNAAVTLDDFVSLEIGDFPAVMLTEQEKCERLSLLSLLLGIDTFGAIASGRGFIIDEGEFPECGFPNGSWNLYNKQKGPRKCVPDLAKYTIWEKTDFSPLVDEIREVCYSIFKGDANGTVEAQLELLLLRLIRRIIRYSRDQKFAKSTGQERFVQMILHNSMLQYLAYSPAPITCFNSFKPFLFGTEGKLNEFEKYPSDSIICNSMVFLSAFAYLHFGTAMNSDDTKFSLDMGGQCVYTSRDIIFALLRILSLILEACDRTIHPKDSSFGHFQYPSQDLQEAMGRPPNLPSPLFCMPIYALLAFVITSGTVAVFQRENSPQAQEVYRIAKEVVLPSMLKIDQLWPSPENYSEKLKNMLSNFL